MKLSLFKAIIDKLLTDVIAFGSPIFFSEIAGQLRCLLERWMFPNIQFRKNDKWAIPEKHIRTAFLITQNVTKLAGEMGGYPQLLEAATTGFIEAIFGYKPEIVLAANTMEYKNYDRYIADCWDILKIIMSSSVLFSYRFIVITNKFITFAVHDK